MGWVRRGEKNLGFLLSHFQGRDGFMCQQNDHIIKQKIVRKIYDLVDILNILVVSVPKLSYPVQLGTITQDNKVAHADGLEKDFAALKAAGVDGVMVDCWWGLVEGQAPQHYVWSGYHHLFNIVRNTNLKLQVPLSPLKVRYINTK